MNNSLSLCVRLAILTIALAGTFLAQQNAPQGKADKGTGVATKGKQNTASAPASAQMMAAAVKRDSEVIAALLTRGADVNFKDTNGVTPLMLAAAMGHMAVVERLMTSGADVNAKDSTDATVLMYAASQPPRPKAERSKVIAALAEKGAASGNTIAYFMSPQSTQDALFPSVAAVFDRMSRSEYMQAFIPNKANAIVAEMHVWGVLYDAGVKDLWTAASRGDSDTVRLLLSQGEKPLFVGPNMTTPLEIAERNKHQAVIDLLKGALAK